MPKAIAISPHLDDAVFSCGGILARLAAAGWDVVVCTVFTRSVANPHGFALACQLDKGLAPDVDYMALRRAEDAEACRRLGVRPLWLPFPEAPHRGYSSANALFGPVAAKDDVVPRLTEAFEEILAAQYDLILGPQAIGGHVDHVQVVKAMQSMSSQTSSILWWSDFPYLARTQSHPLRPFEQIMQALPEQSIKGDSVARLAACAAYTTQVGFQFGNEEKLAHALANAGPHEFIRTAMKLPQTLLNTPL